MTRSNKLIVLLMTLIVSHSASAVIIEGSFNGMMWDYYETNMHVTPEAKFWNAEENAYRGFHGTFWYDTEVATQTGLGVVDGDLTATYSGPHNWLHTTLVGANGGTLDLTSSGSLGTFTPQPTETISVIHNNDRDLFTEYYYDRGDASNYRTGSLSFDSINSDVFFLKDLSLIQDFSYSSVMAEVGYVYFDTTGTLNGVDYTALLFGEINSFDIHVRQPVTVPEPSSIMLTLIGLLGLFIQRLLKGLGLRDIYTQSSC
ncbi:MAG: PEP-CTERM sorting domain-containing protein [Pseudomonadota bacterium]